MDPIVLGPFGEPNGYQWPYDHQAKVSDHIFSHHRNMGNYLRLILFDSHAYNFSDGSILRSFELMP
jgi:hypothetical protein